MVFVYLHRIGFWC